MIYYSESSTSDWSDVNNNYNSFPEPPKSFVIVNEWWKNKATVIFGDLGVQVLLEATVQERIPWQLGGLGICNPVSLSSNYIILGAEYLDIWIGL